MLERLAKNKILFGLFSLASLDFFLLGIQVISKDVAKNVSWTIFGFFVLVLAIQLAILATVARWIDRDWLKATVGGVMLGGNIIAFYVAFYEKFQTFHKIQLLLSALILAAVSGVALYFAKRLPLLLKILVLTMALGSLSVLFAIVSYNPNKGINNPSNVLAQYQNIKFKAKPNIHLVSFDSLQPEAVVKAHMGLTNLTYADLMRKNSTIIKNFFASGAPSNNSFNSQLRLADKRLRGDGYFAGRLESPLVNVLHANGYKLETGFSEDYFGEKGPYIDEYNRFDSGDGLNDSTLCGLASPKEKVLRLYGFCWLYSHLIERSEAEAKSSDWTQEVFDIISQKARDNVPWMTINYIHDPMGHVPTQFDGRDKVAIKTYIADYQRKSQKDLPIILKKLIDTIKRSDPNSIVLVYGDHGPKLSKRIAIEANPSFNVPDRYAIFGALYKNKNPCSNFNNVNHYQRQYMTIERLLAGVFRCLAADPATVDKAVDFSEPYDFGNYLFDKASN